MRCASSAARAGSSRTKCATARGRYGSQRRRVDPTDSPFADRKIKLPMELTSRESTDKVAEAKQRLETVFGRGR